jgi:hypothetical protein
MKSIEERKSDLERICSANGIKPVHRTKIDGNEVFIADGFVPPGAINRGHIVRFGVHPGEFPFGCFLTVWWTEQHKGIGSVVVCDAMHDPGYTPEEKVKMRIASTVYLATQDFMRRKMH